MFPLFYLAQLWRKESTLDSLSLAGLAWRRLEEFPNKSRVYIVKSCQSRFQKLWSKGKLIYWFFPGTLIHKGGFWPRLPPPGACIRGMAKDETKEETAFSEGVVYFSWNNVEISMAN